MKTEKEKDVNEEKLRKYNELMKVILEEQMRLHPEIYKKDGEQ